MDAISDAPDSESALKRVDAFRLLLAGPGTFSIQLNVTTKSDSVNEILLQRYYSSNTNDFPVKGRKQKALTLWTNTLFLKGQVFIAEGEKALAETFDDYELMRPLGLNSVINVPMLKGSMCNVQRIWNSRRMAIRRNCCRSTSSASYREMGSTIQ
jgi:hypothetical protein